MIGWVKHHVIGYIHSFLVHNAVISNVTKDSNTTAGSSVKKEEEDAKEEKPEKPQKPRVKEVLSGMLKGAKTKMRKWVESFKPTATIDPHSQSFTPPTSSPPLPSLFLTSPPTPTHPPPLTPPPTPVSTFQQAFSSFYHRSTSHHHHPPPTTIIHLPPPSPTSPLQTRCTFCGCQW